MPPAQPLTSISRTFLGQEGRDLTIDEEERKVAGMSDYIHREFGPDSSFLFSLYVGYYDRQVQGKTIHSPKNCLPGAGWEVLSTSSVPVPGERVPGSVTRVILANKHVRALVYYWYQGRGRIESSEYRVKWDLLRDAALYGRTEEALVRIVVPIDDPKTGEIPQSNDNAVQTADLLAKRLVVELAAAVDGVMPSGLAGN